MNTYPSLYGVNARPCHPLPGSLVISGIYNNGGPLFTVVTPQLGRSAHVRTWGYDEVWN